MSGDDFERRWAPTLRVHEELSKLHRIPEAVQPPPVQPEMPSAPPEQGDAFVTTVNGRTMISAPATASVAQLASHMPSAKEIAARHLMWMHGRFVGAEEPNRNGAMWSSGDLELAQATVVNGPLNWLHEARHVIGTLASAKFVPQAPKPQQAGLDKWPGAVSVSGSTGSNVEVVYTTATGAITEKAQVTQPHIEATSAIWRWIWPDEAYVIEQASGMGKLWYSMECVSREVSCAGPNGCGNTTSYDAYLAGAACEHVTQRASVRRFVDPTFLGGAVIVPPAAPGWASADARLMNDVPGASSLAEAAYEQAGRPDVTTSEWELMMAQILDYARNTPGK